MDDIEFSDIGDTEAMDSLGEQPDSAIDVGDSTMEGADTSHSVSFGARLDLDRYKELEQQRDAADAVFHGPGNTAEKLVAFQQRETAQKAMNDMIAGSDELRNWSETFDRKIDACLEPLRRNGINISFRGSLDGQSVADDGMESQADDGLMPDAPNGMQNDIAFAEADIFQDMGQSAEDMVGGDSAETDSSSISSGTAVEGDSDAGEAAADSGADNRVSFRGSTSQYYCPVCGHTWWSPYWPNYCPKSGCLGSPKKM